MRHDSEARDIAAFKRLQEFLIILERDTSVRIPARAEHVSMREKTGAAEGIAAANGIQAHGLNPVEKTFPHLQIVNMWRRRAAVLFAHIAHIVQPVAQS